jgi:alpha-N-arabinofuranosidase
MESSAHYDLYLTPEEKDGATVSVRAQLDGFVHDFPSVRISSRKCLLRVVCKADRYIFQYAKPLTTDWHDIASVSTRYLTTETAGGFTGTVIGMYASGNTTADFDFFSYNK